MNTILNKIGATRVTPARFFGFWQSSSLSFSLSLPAPTTSTCSSPIRSRGSHAIRRQNYQRADRRTALRDKARRNYATPSIPSATFQYDGEGTLKLVDGPVLVNNDRVLLESKTFRLNYTAQSSEAHNS